MKKAIIIGSSGQDGRLLTDYLLDKGHYVIGIDNRRLSKKHKNYKYLNVNITNTKSVFNLIKKYKPDHIYYLAAYNHSSEIKDEDNLKSIKLSYDVNVMGLVNFLEGIRQYSNKTKIFYASSSLIFAGTKTLLQDENTPISPTCIYGITKQDGMQLCRLYRHEYDVFASVGILYNHESSYRPDDFLSKKIIKKAIEIKNGSKKKLILGDLSAQADWGFAPDFVDAFYRILNLPKSDDFIIATGKKYSVRDFVKNVFGYFDLSWKHYVIEDKKIIKRKTTILIGNATKLRSKTKWKPTVDFREMIKKLIS